MFMDDGQDPFHVPQQSRKHRLRLINQSNDQQLSPTIHQFTTTAYDPPLVPPQTLLTINAINPTFYNHATLVSPRPPTDPPNPIPEHSRTSFNSSSSSPSLSINPNSIHHMNSLDNTFQYAAQGLSLSLSSEHYYHNQLNSQMYDAVTARTESSRRSVPLGPFTGYASILSRSRFLKPAQQLLDDFCGVDLGSMMNYPLECMSENGIVKDPITCSDGVEHRYENSGLVLLLDEVYKRYKLYCQQMQSVVASFGTVAGLGNAAPYVSFAFNSMAKHFTSLKNAILDQFQFTGKIDLAHDGATRDETSLLWRAGQGNDHQNPFGNRVFPQSPAWRSQRGLPDRAVAVLKNWLFEHFLHPYPSDPDKQILAHQTGLSKNQVSNWFINARVRLWKPMVEEIHMLETKRAQVAVADNCTSAANQQPVSLLQPINPVRSFQTTSSQKPDQYIKPKSSEISDTSRLTEEGRNDLFNPNLSTIDLAGVSRSRSDESSDVSLALGLYQSNGSELSVPFSVSLAHHFGLGTDSKVYMENGFEGKN